MNFNYTLTIKKVLLFLLIALPIYLFISLYYIDRHYFLSPIEYQTGIVIRSDNRGDGYFGARRSGGRKHEGIDLLADIGTPVQAARSGKVTISRTIKNRNTRKGSGNYVVLRHPGNLTTVYAHLSQVYVRKNDRVRQGQIIGAVGKTGNANYRNILPHLHFELRLDGIPQDPAEYLE